LDYQTPTIYSGLRFTLHEQDDIFQRNQCIIIILFEIKAIASVPILVVLGLY
jgi:hypothetical protein